MRAISRFGCAAVIAALVGCGGPTAQVEIVATQFRPDPQSSVAFAAKSGWKKQAGKPGTTPGGPVDSGPTFTPTDNDPESTDPGIGSPGTSEVVDPEPRESDNTTVAEVDNPFLRPRNPMTTTPDPMDPENTDPEPTFDPERTTDEPGAERLVPRSATIPPTPELLAGGWRGEPKHYVLEKGEWVDDTQFFVVDFGTTTDKKDNEIDVVRVSFEVDGSLVKLPPVEYVIDPDTNVASFSHPQMGPDPIVARIVGDERIEIRGKVQGFTVVRYYAKIPG